MTVLTPLLALSIAVAPAAPEPPPRRTTTSYAWVPTAATVVLLTGAGVFYGLARAEEDRIRNHAETIASPAEAAHIRQVGETQQTISFIIGGAAAASAVVAAVLFIKDGAGGTVVSAAPIPGGGAVTLSARFP